MTDIVKKLFRYCDKHSKKGCCEFCPVFNDETASKICESFDFEDMHEEQQEYLIDIFEQTGEKPFCRLCENEHSVLCGCCETYEYYQYRCGKLKQIEKGDD